jgi:hypothetical protein
MSNLTFDDLRKKRAEGLIASEKAINHCYHTYQDLKRLINEINSGSLDVADYYSTAMRLGNMLREISAGYDNTIFNYFADHLDPGQKGDVRCFRMECRQLSEELKTLDQLRAKQRQLTIVK